MKEELKAVLNTSQICWLYVCPGKAAQDFALNVLRSTVLFNPNFNTHEDSIDMQ